ncbi:MAG: hypothetical protein CMJ62_03985 [Planctomycetaceae bacterium]|nr:hypothetical protein [Planctomycetaceae bacterium]
MRRRLADDSTQSLPNIARTTDKYGRNRLAAKKKNCYCLARLQQQSPLQKHPWSICGGFHRGSVEENLAVPGS